MVRSCMPHIRTDFWILDFWNFYKFFDHFRNPNQLRIWLLVAMNSSLCTMNVFLNDGLCTRVEAISVASVGKYSERRKGWITCSRNIWSRGFTSEQSCQSCSTLTSSASIILIIHYTIDIESTKVAILLYIYFPALLIVLVTATPSPPFFSSVAPFAPSHLLMTNQMKSLMGTKNTTET